MKLLFCGSRNDFDIEKVYKIILYYICKLNKYEWEIIHGNALGIDSEVDRAFRPMQFMITTYPPDYETYGKPAPIIRDKFMVDKSDKVIALWNGYSRGTKFTIDYAQKHNKPVTVYIVK